MKNTFKLIQILQNLNHLKRAGGTLFMGLPSELNMSIAEHSYFVTYLAMLFADSLPKTKKEKINQSKLLKYCLVHDWSESIIGDLPSGSPSWQTFWNIEIRKEIKQANQNAHQAMLDLIKEEIDVSDYREINLNNLEKQIYSAANISAMLISMLEWKYAGFKHDGWEMVWFNTLDRLKKIDLPFIPALTKEIGRACKKNSKPYNIFLAQPQKQTNPQHKV